MSFGGFYFLAGVFVERTVLPSLLPFSVGMLNCAQVYSLLVAAASLTWAVMRPTWQLGTWRPASTTRWGAGQSSQPEDAQRESAVLLSAAKELTSWGGRLAQLARAWY